jgi:transposase
VLSNGHAGFGGRSGETHQRKRRQGAPGRPNLAAGKTPMEALRSLKRQVSDAIYSRLQADARRAAAFARTTGPGGQPGNDSAASAAGSHPEHRLFGPATPEPDITLRRPGRRTPTGPGPAPKKTRTSS